MMDFNLDNLLSQILYVLSGFFFGIFASRYSVLAWRAVRSRGLLSAIVQLCVLLLAFIVFPLLFSTRTVAALCITPYCFSFSARALRGEIMSEEKTLKLDVPIAEKFVQPMADTFKVLGDPTRIRILALLAEGEACVTNIADSLEMTQSAISHQLRLLRHAGLVKFTKTGKEVFYSLDDQHVLTLFAQALDHIKHKL